MHHGEGGRLEFGEGTEDATGLSGVGNVAGERALLHPLHGPEARFDEIGFRERSDIAEMVEKVGAEERFPRFLEEESGIPAVGKVG